MIKISKMNKVSNELEVFEYTSVNNACQQNGATSGMNKKAGLNYLNNLGFDLTTLEETATTTRKQSSIIERLIKMCKVLDKTKIKELEKSRLELSANMTSSNDYDKIIEINTELKLLQNPEVTLESINLKVLELWNEKQEELRLEEIENTVVVEAPKPKAKKTTKK